MCAPNFWGGCLLQILGVGGVCSKFWGWGGVCSKFSGGGVPNFRGGCLQFSEYGQRSAGTHPTGMHSCFIIKVVTSGDRENDVPLLESLEIMFFLFCDQFV